MAASWHRPVFAAGPPMVPGLRVDSVTMAVGAWELRVHQVSGAPAGTRVTQTGWATGPGELLVSALHALHGFEPTPEPLRAPQGTACTRWAEVPRLTGPAGAPRCTPAWPRSAPHRAPAGCRTRSPRRYRTAPGAWRSSGPTARATRSPSARSG